MTYEIKGQTPRTFVQLTWSNPFIGRNAAGGLVFNVQTLNPVPGMPPLKLPVPSKDFRLITTCGAGDNDVQMRYTLQPKQ